MSPLSIDLISFRTHHSDTVDIFCPQESWVRQALPETAWRCRLPVIYYGGYYIEIIYHVSTWYRYRSNTILIFIFHVMSSLNGPSTIQIWNYRQLVLWHRTITRKLKPTVAGVTVPLQRHGVKLHHHVGNIFQNKIRQLYQACVACLLKKKKLIFTCGNNCLKLRIETVYSWSTKKC